MFGLTNFQPLEVVDRASETQPQVVENINKLTKQEKGLAVTSMIIWEHLNKTLQVIWLLLLLLWTSTFVQSISITPDLSDISIISSMFLCAPFHSYQSKVCNRMVYVIVRYEWINVI